MKIHIKELSENNDYQDFVNIVFKIYKNNKNYIPPIISDEIKSLKKETNPAFEECDAKFWIALSSEDEVVGRIGAIINHNYNKLKSEKQGRFSRFESIDNQEVANILLKTAEDWLKSQGMKKVVGPLGFNNLDPSGILIEGQQFTQSYGSTYHPEYYKKLIENCGYEKDIDWIEYKMKVTESALKDSKKGSDLLKRRYNFEVKEFNSSKELSKYADDVFKIINESYDELHYVSPFSEKLRKYYADKYFKLLNPKFIKVALIDGEAVAFYVTMPSMFNALRKVNGKVNIFNFWHLLKARKGKGTDTIEQLLAGVVPKYSKSGAMVPLVNAIHHEMMKRGLKYIETTGMFEDNLKVLANWKRYEIVNEKRRRAFIKEL